MSESEKLTITLTDRRPVTVVKADWPIVASTKDWDNEFEFQANRIWRLLVRQHEDGRAIVYGVYTSNYQDEADRRGGEMLEAGADIPAAIRRVGEHLGFEEVLIERCTGDLPAEEV